MALHRSGRIIESLVPTNFSVQLDPFDWVIKAIDLHAFKSTVVSILQKYLGNNIFLNPNFYFTEKT